MGKYDCEGCKHRTNHTDEGFKFCSGCDRSYLGADSGYHADRYEKEEAEMSMTESERYTWWDDVEAYSNYIRPAVTKRLAEYEDIGTVSEFRELKEKATAKKPTYVRYFGEAGYYIGLCPTCKCGNNSEYEYCGDCGQKLQWFDWSEGKE